MVLDFRRRFLLWDSLGILLLSGSLFVWLSFGPWFVVYILTLIYQDNFCYYYWVELSLRFLISLLTYDLYIFPVLRINYFVVFTIIVCVFTFHFSIYFLFFDTSSTWNKESLCVISACLLEPEFGTSICRTWWFMRLLRWGGFFYVFPMSKFDWVRESQ